MVVFHLAAAMYKFFCGGWKVKDPVIQDPFDLNNERPCKDLNTAHASFEEVIGLFMFYLDHNTRSNSGRGTV